MDSTQELLEKLKKAGFAGEIDSTDVTRDLYSHDASMFELRPQAVVSPKNSQDVQELVKQVVSAKKACPGLSLTARSAGTDMSGGAINDSIIVDFNQHFRTIRAVTSKSAHV